MPEQCGPDWRMGATSGVHFAVELIQIASRIKYHGADWR